MWCGAIVTRVAWRCKEAFKVEATGIIVPRTRARLPLQTTWSLHVSQAISTGISPF